MSSSHLVGYDSTNIFRIWIPSKQRVIRTRDVTFNETLFYDPALPDITQLLRAEVEQIVEVVDMASSQPLTDGLDLDIDSDSDLDLDEPIEPLDSQGSQDKSSDNSPDHRLPTPAETRSSISTPDRQLTPSTDAAEPSGSIGGQRELTPITDRNTAPRAQEISSDFSEENIIAERTRHRRQAYLTVPQEPEQLHAYFSAFAIGLRRLHRDQLPPPPRSWRELQSHPNREGFLAAAEKEYRGLERRQTFRPVPKTPGLKLLPLMWVFTYKFDTNGFLDKYKARLCVRGDLQDPTQLDTYATTLAARIFRTFDGYHGCFRLRSSSI